MIIPIDIDRIEQEAASMDAELDALDIFTIKDDAECIRMAFRLQKMVVKVDAAIAALHFLIEQIYDEPQPEEWDGMSTHTPQLLPGMKKMIFEGYRDRYQRSIRNVEERERELRGILPINDSV